MLGKPPSSATQSWITYNGNNELSELVPSLRCGDACGITAASHQLSQTDSWPSRILKHCLHKGAVAAGFAL